MDEIGAENGRQIWTELVDFGPLLVEVGQNLLISRPQACSGPSFCLTSGQCLPNSRAKVGRCRPNSGRDWSMSGQVRPKAGQIWSRCGKVGRFWAELAQTQSTLSRVRPHSGMNLTEVDGVRPHNGQIRQQAGPMCANIGRYSNNLPGPRSRTLRWPPRHAQPAPT